MDSTIEAASSPSRDERTRAEIISAIESDDTALGDIWRRTEAGESADEIRVARGNERPNFVWNYLRTARAIVDGDLPTAPTLALGAARTLRRILKQNDFSAETTATLERRLQVLEDRGADPNARADEERRAVAASVEAERNAVPGVYVYTLPHYLRHPYDEVANRTLFKIGRADRSVIRRFREQTRTTALPEDPVLLRVYATTEDNAIDAERAFHRLLVAADHDRSQARTGGTEWFLTSLRFLDEIAATIGLAATDINDLGDTPGG